MKGFSGIGLSWGFPKVNPAFRHCSSRKSKSKANRKSGVEINNLVEIRTICRVVCTRSSCHREIIFVIMDTAPSELENVISIGCQTYLFWQRLFVCDGDRRKKGIAPPRKRHSAFFEVRKTTKYSIFQVGKSAKYVETNPTRTNQQISTPSRLAGGIKFFSKPHGARAVRTAK